MQEFFQPRWLRLLTNMTGIRSNSQQPTFRVKTCDESNIRAVLIHLGVQPRSDLDAEQ
jgi:hypothetical protein